MVCDGRIRRAPGSHHHRERRQRPVLAQSHDTCFVIGAQLSPSRRSVPQSVRARKAASIREEMGVLWLVPAGL